MNVVLTANKKHFIRLMVSSFLCLLHHIVTPVTSSQYHLPLTPHSPQDAGPGAAHVAGLPRAVVQAAAAPAARGGSQAGRGRQGVRARLQGALQGPQDRRAAAGQVAQGALRRLLSVSGVFLCLCSVGDGFVCGSLVTCRDSSFFYDLRNRLTDRPRLTTIIRQTGAHGTKTFDICVKRCQKV